MKLQFKTKFDANIIKNNSFNENVLPISIWDVEHVRNGEILSKTTDRNTVTNEGLNALLDIMFSAGTQITNWYILIFETNTTPSTSTTYATPVFTECTTYDETTREAFVEAGAASQTISNSASRAEFTMNASKTIYGGALVGGGSAPSTKGNTAGGGKIFCASKFTESKVLVDDDVLRVTVTITAANPV